MIGVYNKAYITRMAHDRLQELHDRYYMYCRGIDESGNELAPNSANNGRVTAKRDLQLVTLFLELLQYMPNGVYLNDEDAIKGYEKLIEPNEKHRNYKRSGF